MAASPDVISVRDRNGEVVILTRVDPDQIKPEIIQRCKNIKISLQREPQPRYGVFNGEFETKHQMNIFAGFQEKRNSFHRPMIESIPVYTDGIKQIPLVQCGIGPEDKGTSLRETFNVDGSGRWNKKRNNRAL